jgi:3-deoxy-8-phosphooctulonate synthase
MATNITLQDYLNNDPGVKEAKKILSEATKSLTGARNVTPDVLAELKAIQSRAEQVYNKLVSDMRGLSIMAKTGYPVVFDATHSVQLPGGQGSTSGGQREFVPVLARAAVAVGISGLFMETHPDPANAKSDGPNAVPLHCMRELLASLAEIDRVVKSKPFLENDFS